MRTLLALAVLVLAFLNLPATAQTAVEGLDITTPDGGRYSFTVEVARTPDEQAQGLMYRTSMAPDAGMLFVMPHVRNDVYFWMKDTLIPLDMLFIRADGRIANIHPQAVPGDKTPIPAGEPVLAVLELNGGRAAQLGLQVGSTVSSPSLAKAQVELVPALKK